MVFKSIWTSQVSSSYWSTSLLGTFKLPIPILYCPNNFGNLSPISHHYLWFSLQYWNLNNLQKDKTFGTHFDFYYTDVENHYYGNAMVFTLMPIQGGGNLTSVTCWETSFGDLIWPSSPHGRKALKRPPRDHFGKAATLFLNVILKIKQRAYLANILSMNWSLATSECTSYSRDWLYSIT